MRIEFFKTLATITIIMIIIVSILMSQDFSSKKQNQLILDPTPNFDGRYTLEETGTSEISNSPKWWVNSGGRVIVNNGNAQTIQGDLNNNDRWYQAFSKSNPDETDNGLHPQNIFRLVSKTKWQNYSQQVYYKIDKLNLSDSLHRRESNGLFLFNRYVDGDNLYYTGIRIDGNVSIKKKKNGVYYDVGSSKIINGIWNRENNPIVLPLDQWIGLKTTVQNLENNKVDIKLYTDIGKTNNWTLALEFVDDNRTYGGNSFVEEGNVGIRTDFMDAEFSDYQVTKL